MAEFDPAKRYTLKILSGFLGFMAYKSANIATHGLLSKSVKAAELLTPTVDPSLIDLDSIPEFVSFAHRVGGFNTLGYRLSNPWIDQSELTSIAYQHALLQKDLEGKISPRNILDELSQNGFDPMLSDGTYGVVIPQSRSTTHDDYYNLPKPIRQTAERLEKEQIDPGLLTAPYTDYGPFGIARFQRMALQLWQDDGRVELVLIGDAVQRMKLIPQNAILDIPQIDDQPYLPNGCQLTSSSWMGEASYYSRAGCLGCSPIFRMSNGEILDDNRLTLAFMKTPLNVNVVVENLDNGQSTVAKVTDRGGFEPYGRIADLSQATKEAIGGNDLTRVRITLLNC